MAEGNKVEIKDRLRSVSVHLAAIAGMVEEDRNGLEVIHQLTDVGAALDEIERLTIEDGIRAFRETMHTGTSAEMRTEALVALVDLYVLTLERSFWRETERVL